MKIKRSWNISIIFSLIFLITGYSLESANSTTKNHNNSYKNFNQAKERNYSRIRGSCWTTILYSSLSNTKGVIYFQENNKYYADIRSIGYVNNARYISKYTGRWKQDKNSIIVNVDKGTPKTVRYIILSENSITVDGKTIYTRGC